MKFLCSVTIDIRIACCENGSFRGIRAGSAEQV